MVHTFLSCLLLSWPEFILNGIISSKSVWREIKAACWGQKCFGSDFIQLSSLFRTKALLCFPFLRIKSGLVWTKVIICETIKGEEEHRASDVKHQSEERTLLEAGIGGGWCPYLLDPAGGWERNGERDKTINRDMYFMLYVEARPAWL